MNFMQVEGNRMKEYCEGLVSVFQERYKGWEGAKQFSGTPDRLVRMYDDFCWPPERISSELDKQFRLFKNDYDEMLVVGPIKLWTLCPHHLVPVELSCWIGYIPRGRVLGLSKFARIAVIMGKRPIMQEEYTTELVGLFMEKLEPRGMAVYVEGRHGCMVSRGVEQDSLVATSGLRGDFLESQSTRSEFFAIVRGLK